MPDTGTVTVNNLKTNNPDNTFAIRSTAGAVFQNPDDQIVASLVENDVAFGPENLGIENPELRQRVEESLAKVGLAGSGKRETTALSGGQKQRVAIAGVLAMHPSILIFDGLMRVCKELHEQGMTVIMITHFMEEAAEADRVIVLNDGHCVLDGTPDEVLTQDHVLRDLNLDVPFATHMSRLLQDRGINVGTHIETATLKEELCRSLSNTPLTKRQKKAGEVQRYALRNVSFTLNDGEFLAIAGHTGSGKSTLVQHLNGLANPTEGRVLWNGKDLADRKNANCARGDIGVVFQYPEHQLFAETVYEDVAFGPRNMGLPEDEVDTRIREALADVHLDFDTLSKRSPFELSGGQQRRVAFAGVLAMRPTTLVLDEPVAGLDPASRTDFLDLIKQLHEQRDLTVVMVSHNMNDIALLADRMLVMHEGEVAFLGTPEEIFTKHAVELREIGLGIPHAQTLANQLRAEGMPLPEKLYLPESLADEIARVLGGSEAVQS